VYEEVMTDRPATFAMSIMATANNNTFNANSKGISFFSFMWAR